MPWGDPGVTQQVLVQENQINMPSSSGGSKVIILQRAGLLKRLRFYAQAALNVTAFTAAPSKSPYGPLGGYLSRLRVTANGQIPLFDLSGFGAQIYNEIQNRDGSVLATPSYIAESNVTAALKLLQYDTPSAVAEYYAKCPLEFQFALPVNISGRISELGLWLLQNQAIDVSIEAVFNALYNGTAGNNYLWSGGTITAAPDLTNSFIQIERELYDIPSDPKNYPNLAWVHQVIEFVNPFTGSQAVFNIPRAGLLLRAIVTTVDASGNPVEYSDINNLSYLYGANETPIKRPGWAMVQEFVQDYNRLPPKGSVVLDFYKWGFEGLKLVKDTETIANLRIQTQYNTTTTGTQYIILDRLVPVTSRAS